ncbi:hypothetical protein [Leucobacter massiliensis]|uniref:hypothetical protein n=1 Tax=Leucobacter massiliensis TaxID=1686285 RepID=UPI0011B1E56B|nr:hypothetical protein [Leucobacter massiliensis]
MEIPLAVVPDAGNGREPWSGSGSEEGSLPLVQSESQRQVIYESVSGTLSSSDSESSVSDSLIESLSQAENHLSSESAAPAPGSRFASLLADIEEFGSER